MPLISRDEAMTKLAQYLKGVPTVFRAAWGRTRKSEQIDLIDQTKTTKANLMRDYVCGDLTRHWIGNPSVRYVEVGQQSLFIIEQTFAFRIKKLDRASCSSNYPTDQDQNFRQQGQIDGLPQLHNFELGWVPNATETDVDDVRVVCLNGDRPYWWQSVERPADNVYDLFQGQRDPNSPAPTYSPGASEVTIEPKKK